MEVVVMGAVDTMAVEDTTAADIIMATIIMVTGTEWRLVRASTTAMVRVTAAARMPIGGGWRRAAPIGARGTTIAEIIDVPLFCNQHARSTRPSMRL
jgi:hypothetical protein